MTKYNNSWITADGIKFQSKDEYHYYEHLKKLKASEKILNFELQPTYELQPKFTDNEGNTVRAITYALDFMIYHLDGTLEIVDVKGVETQQGILRIKILRYLLRDKPIKISIVSRSLKYGGESGFIPIEELKRIRRTNKKVKGVVE